MEGGREGEGRKARRERGDKMYQVCGLYSI